MVESTAWRNTSAASCIMPARGTVAEKQHQEGSRRLKMKWIQ